VTTAPSVWYYVRDLDDARRFYRELLGFEETSVDFEERWSHLEHGEMHVGLSEGEPQEDGPVAHVDVDDLKAEAERLREAGVVVGVIVEIPHGEMRLVDVYDPDGNRIQLAQEL
jgi:catechol 2,3-dioxygenase-like lactoylglutathione lyase family enzyme